ncbi:hypothetical protein DPQ33_02105 [Oceanidesulfovibrio indonesiensis]|uniref:Phosphohydrolase n=1 Tax=Oceanidesulfovibrio indonesiensis TaxID=54767 RepID=A0A7M3MHK5_9BACT|nr:hypothetical protein [Oceanidesulfovibrio indonesiensis]TVM19174.1 hypothetical protein DPQ33_02105 [Oceanidesulfovibrio indonesiensis]
MSTWIQTCSGEQFYPFEPYRNEFRIEDIAHALGNICRFGGHTRAFYSVAQHSVLVSENVLPEYARWGLLHDAAEAFFGDMPTPIKAVLPDYYAAERQTLMLIADHFGVCPDAETALAVKMVDRLVFRDEVFALMTPVHPELTRQMRDMGVGGCGLGLRIEPLPPEQAAALFMDRYRQLWPEAG